MTTKEDTAPKIKLWNMGKEEYVQWKIDVPVNFYYWMEDHKDFKEVHFNWGNSYSPEISSCKPLTWFASQYSVCDVPQTEKHRGLHLWKCKVEKREQLVEALTEAFAKWKSEGGKEVNTVAPPDQTIC